MVYESGIGSWLNRIKQMNSFLLTVSGIFVWMSLNAAERIKSSKKGKVFPIGLFIRDFDGQKIEIGKGLIKLFPKTSLTFTTPEF